MEEFSAYREDLILLSDSLGEGVDQQWSHELRKQILLSLHRLKNNSRKLANVEIEAELIAIEVTLGYGSGSNIEPNDSLIEDHQIRLLELAELNRDVTEPTCSEENTEQELADLENEQEIAEQQGDAVPEQPSIQLIICNCPGRDAARELAHGLVKSRLAACVNIIANIGSVYWWQGEIKDTAECQLQVKTASYCLDNVIDYIKQNHPNDVPEIIAIAIDSGNEEYFDWVRQETSEEQDG